MQGDEGTTIGLFFLPTFSSYLDPKKSAHISIWQGNTNSKLSQIPNVLLSSHDICTVIKDVLELRWSLEALRQNENKLTNNLLWNCTWQDRPALSRLRLQIFWTFCRVVYVGRIVSTSVSSLSSVVLVGKYSGSEIQKDGFLLRFNNCLYSGSVWIIGTFLCLFVSYPGFSLQGSPMAGVP